MEKNPKKNKNSEKFSWKKTLGRVLLALGIVSLIALIENIILAVTKFIINLFK